MIVKTTLLLFLMTGFPLLAQAPPNAPAAAPDANAAGVTNRNDLLRRAPRQNIAASTNATNVQTKNTVATNVPAQQGLPPTLPGLPATKTSETVVAITPADGTNAPATPDDEKMIGAGEIYFPAVKIDDVLKIYAELVGRTVLRPTALPAPEITLKTQTPLTRKEAIQAIDSVLALNGITMIPSGDKFVKAVPSTQAQQEGAPFSKLTGDQLPEAGQYVTHIVQLKYARPTEVVPVLQPFAKIPNSIMPIETSQIGRAHV